VAPAFTLSGLFIAAVGLYVEIGRLLGQAIDNIGKASKEAADRRLRAKELALEKQRLDLEAARMAQDYAAREDQHAPAAVLANERAEYVPAGAVAPGQVVVINHPPVQRWSPGLAAVLSFFVPGLGQVYKRQIINGIVWFFLVGMGYLALILPGMVLHFFCGLGALSGNPWTNARSEYHSTYAYRLGKSHLEMTDHYLLMAATPHKSNPGRFQRFPSLLDGDIESLKAAMASQLAPLYLRPIKEALTTFRGPETGVAHKLFRKREVRSADFKVQGAELAFYEALTYYVEDQ
jgi:TM2 domain-containing membrane protein YozV